jgi:hypothetical protein
MKKIVFILEEVEMICVRTYVGTIVQKEKGKLFSQCFQRIRQSWDVSIKRNFTIIT